MVFYYMEPIIHIRETYFLVSLIFLQVKRRFRFIKIIFCQGQFEHQKKD